MDRTKFEWRADPEAAKRVIDSVFEGTSFESKIAFEGFLRSTLELLAKRHADRWGVTLFRDALRVNTGWVECLVLQPGWLHVLIEKSSAPAGLELGREYEKAQGCAMAAIQLSEIGAEDGFRTLNHMVQCTSRIGDIQGGLSATLPVAFVPKGRQSRSGTINAPCFADRVGQIPGREAAYRS